MVNVVPIVPIHLFMPRFNFNEAVNPSANGLCEFSSDPVASLVRIDLALYAGAFQRFGGRCSVVKTSCPISTGVASSDLESSRGIGQNSWSGIGLSQPRSKNLSKKFWVSESQPIRQNSASECHKTLSRSTGGWLDRLSGIAASTKLR